LKLDLARTRKTGISEKQEIRHILSFKKIVETISSSQFKKFLSVKSILIFEDLENPTK
jgi:hypothetical protein